MSKPARNDWLKMSRLADPAQDRQEILATLDRLNEGLRTGSFALANSAFSKSAETTFVGSEAGKTSRGGEAVSSLLRRLTAASHAYSWTWNERVVTVHGDTAWVYAEGTEHVRGSHNADNPYRLTAIMEKQNGEWLCVHYHGAEPVTPVEQVQIAS
jgi:ketosteroid isomerase-like protein